MDNLSYSDFLKSYSDEEKCLKEIIRNQYPNGIYCKHCKNRKPFYLIKGRKSIGCKTCRFQIQPLTGTIFEHSSTPLTVWFYAMYLMLQTRCGISSAQLSRQLGVTYKTAWRIGHKIRERMVEKNPTKLKGVVEVDETFIGGSAWKNFRKLDFFSFAKEPVMGMVERKGKVIIVHMRQGIGSRAILPPILKHIDTSSHIMTDQYTGYTQLKKYGYKHDFVVHKKQFKRGNIHTQNIENVWSHLKRGIKGVYRSVSPKHLQKYCNEFSFRYNYRNEDSFNALMKVVALSTF
jgi:transposase-like protein